MGEDILTLQGVKELRIQEDKTNVLKGIAQDIHILIDLQLDLPLSFGTESNHMVVRLYFKGFTPLVEHLKNFNALYINICTVYHFFYLILQRNILNQPCYDKQQTNRRMRA